MNAGRTVSAPSQARRLAGTLSLQPVPYRIHLRPGSRQGHDGRNSRRRPLAEAGRYRVLLPGQVQPAAGLEAQRHRPDRDQASASGNRVLLGQRSPPAANELCRLPYGQSPGRRRQHLHQSLAHQPAQEQYRPLRQCHENVQADVFAIQDAVSLQAGSGPAGRAAAEDRSRRHLGGGSGRYPEPGPAALHGAITWWEWTAVSENSMGADFGDQTRSQLQTADGLAVQAQALLEP